MYVIVENISGDQLSVAMTLEQANYIANGEREVAARQGSPCPLAVVESTWELAQVQEAARRRMAGNPPRKDIIWDAPVLTPAQQDAELVGLAEIADRLGVARRTVDSWRTRGVMPVPSHTVGGRPAWRWAVIRDWAVKPGTLTS